MTTQGLRTQGLTIQELTIQGLTNRVGGKRKFSSYFRFPTSHTTVRAVRHTAVPYTLCN